MIRKGILLAGGLATRFYPATRAVSKQLLPIFDKPMIYYPLATLMLIGVREILIISTPKDVPSFEELFGDGSQWGINIQYAIQPEPDGLAQALIIAEEFIDSSPSVLILGDNFFYGGFLKEKLEFANSRQEGSTIFVYQVQDPKRYGVAEFDFDGRVVGLEEKPEIAKSHYAVTGIYFYDKHAAEYAKQLKLSRRGELEITDLNKIYLKLDQLNAVKLGRGFAWLDTGTPEAFLEASHFVQTIERRQGQKISCPEEIAYKNKWINKAQLKKLAQAMPNSEYGQYLLKISSELGHEGN